MEVEVGDITCPEQLNGRMSVDSGGVRRLAESIRRNGLFNPIVVRAVGEGFELVAGARRLAAWRLVMGGRIPVQVVQASDRQAGEIRLAENSARAELTPFEEAIQLGTLLKTCSGGTDELAEISGRSRDWVEGRLELLDWPESLVQHVHQGHISLGAGRKLAQISPDATREYYIGHGAEHGINVRTAADWLRQSRAAGGTVDAETVVTGGSTAMEFATEVRALCFVCRELRPLAATSSVRICGECVDRLEGKASNGGDVSV